MRFWDFFFRVKLPMKMCKFSFLKLRTVKSFKFLMLRLFLF